MSDPHVGRGRPVAGGVADELGVFDSAVGYLLGSLRSASRMPLHGMTPCAGWDVGALLEHVADSAAAFTELFATSTLISLDGHAARGRSHGAAGRAARHVQQLVAARHEALPGAGCSVADRVLPVRTMIRVAALELAVHGWDLAASVSDDACLPDHLADRLLVSAMRLVTPASRGSQFAPARTVAVDASTGERVLAHVGRAARKPVQGFAPSSRQRW